MNNEETNTPELRNPEQIRWDTLRPYLLDPRENYPEPYTILEFNGVGFGKMAVLEPSADKERTVKRSSSLS